MKKDYYQIVVMNYNLCIKLLLLQKLLLCLNFNNNYLIHKL